MIMAAKNQKEQSVSRGVMMRFRLAGLIINQAVRDAEIIIKCRANGPTLKVGKSGGESFTLLLDRPETLWEIVRHPDPGLGEFYMDGKWKMEKGDLGALITALGRNHQALFDGPAGTLFSAMMRRPLPEKSHEAESSKEQVQHHYDIGNDLYELFLDEGMNYSCAFFDDPAMSLRDAQLNKIHTSIRRLDIQPGMKVLDIGCGWGETTRIIAQKTEATSVIGISLAEKQIECAAKRAQKMNNPPRYILQDYRDHARENQGIYDRIVSIGMFEHVGDDKHDAYFSAIRDQLAPNGKALVHSILNVDKNPSRMMNSPWLEKYIFPGGRVPDLPDMLTNAKKAGLKLTHEPYIQDTFHYAETLRHWRKNFIANTDKLPPHYDARFQHMWEFYLALAEAMFDAIGFTVGQVVFEREEL